MNDHRIYSVGDTVVVVYCGIRLKVEVVMRSGDSYLCSDGHDTRWHFVTELSPVEDE